MINKLNKSFYFVLTIRILNWSKNYVQNLENQILTIIILIFVGYLNVYKTSKLFSYLLDNLI